MDATREHGGPQWSHGLGLELGLGLSLAKTFDALAMAAAKAS